MQYRRTYSALVSSIVLLLAMTAPSLARDWFVATNGSDSAAGTDAAPYLTISKGVSMAQAGDRVVVKGGVYRVTSSISFPRSGTSTSKQITLKAADGQQVTVKGSKPVTGWTRVAGTTATWRISNWTYYFGAWTTNPSDARNKGRNQLFVDGKIYEEVAARTSLKAGSFYVDDAANQIDLWMVGNADPTTHTVEATATGGPLLTTNSRSYLTIQGINFEHCANGPQDTAAVLVTGGSRATADGISVSWANGAGISVGKGTWHTVRNSKFNNNGQLGVHSSSAVDNLMENCETSYNNLHPNKRYNAGWEAGGNKFSRARRFTLRNHLAIDNNGSGIWFDVDNQNCIIENSISSGNHHGIHYEISYTGTLRNNLTYRNTLWGQADSSPVAIGIYISSSAKCKVYNNTVYGNETYGIQINTTIRGDGANRNVTGANNLIYNNIISENEQVGTGTKSFSLGYGNNYDPVAYPNPPHRPALPAVSNSLYVPDYNYSDYNLFWPKKQNDAFFVAGGSNRPDNLADWQRLSNQDLHSIWADPKFTDKANGDFTLLSGSPAIDHGKTLTEVTKDVAGTPRPAGAAYDIGAYESPVVGDQAPPQVVGVYVSGSDWTPAFLTAVGNTKGYAIPVGSGVQLKPLPWGNINQVRIVFSEDMAAVTADKFILMGVNTAAYPFTLSYDSASRTATMTFAQSIAADKLTLGIKETLTDFADNKLDGEWDNPTDLNDPSSDTYPSGNAVQAGTMFMRLNVLPGDADQNGIVNSLDANLIRAALSKAPGQAGYSTFADIDGNGIINSLDYTPVRANLSSTLPAGELGLTGGYTQMN